MRMFGKPVSMGPSTRWHPLHSNLRTLRLRASQCFKTLDRSPRTLALLHFPQQTRYKRRETRPTLMWNSRRWQLFLFYHMLSQSKSCFVPDPRLSSVSWCVFITRVWNSGLMDSAHITSWVRFPFMFLELSFWSAYSSCTDVNSKEGVLIWLHALQSTRWLHSSIDSKVLFIPLANFYLPACIHLAILLLDEWKEKVLREEIILCSKKKEETKINKSILTCWTIWNISPWQIYHALTSLISLGLQYSLDFIFNSSWKSLFSHACYISTHGMQCLASTEFHHSLSILLFMPSKPTLNRWHYWILLPAANVASSPWIAAVLITFLLLWQSDLQKEGFIWASSSRGIRVIMAMKMTVSSMVAGSGSCEIAFVYPKAQNREKIGNRARLYVVLELDLNEVLTQQGYIT